MSVEYLIGIRLDLGKVFTPIKEVEDAITNNLAKFGWEGQRIGITGIVPLILKAEREMTETEINDVKRILLEECIKTFGHAKIEYIRRQSGNVLQSASQ